jgi:hypothetical protein
MAIQLPNGHPSISQPRTIGLPPWTALPHCSVVRRAERAQIVELVFCRRLGRPRVRGDLVDGTYAGGRLGHGQPSFAGSHTNGKVAPKPGIRSSGPNRKVRRLAYTRTGFPHQLVH